MLRPMYSDSYETDPLLQQYLLFHYGEPADLLPWDFGPAGALQFPVRCVREGLDLEQLPSRRRALDVGCAVGRSTFELGMIFDEAVGVDFSDAFIMAARLLSREGRLPFPIQETGTITREVVARKPQSVSGQVRFEQGDAQALRPDLGRFNCLLAANLLCRLHRPLDFLRQVPALLETGGQLIITTPNTWLESFTAREFWLGATPETGEPLEAIQSVLEGDFQLDQVWDMPFLIREHRRKFQWSVAQASRWIRLG